MMKPKKISNSEHRKRKRKKPESKERKRVNAKTRKISFLVILLVTISDLKVKTVAGFNPRCTKLDHEIVYKSFSLGKDSLQLGPGKDNTERLNQSVQEPVHRTEDLKFCTSDL